jgi:hypothetical protein
LTGGFLSKGRAQSQGWPSTIKIGGFSAAATLWLPLAEMKHGVPEERIRLGLVTGTIGFEPRDDVRIQAQGDGFFPGPIKLTDFGSAPIDNRGASEKSMSSPLLAAMTRMSRSSSFVRFFIGNSLVAWPSWP